MERDSCELSSQHAPVEQFDELRLTVGQQSVFSDLIYASAISQDQNFKTTDMEFFLKLNQFIRAHVDEKQKILVP